MTSLQCFYTKTVSKGTPIKVDIPITTQHRIPPSCIGGLHSRICHVQCQWNSTLINKYRESFEEKDLVHLEALITKETAMELWKWVTHKLLETWATSTRETYPNRSFTPKGRHGRFVVDEYL